MKVGILAIQGNFYKHKIVFSQLDVETVFVKNADDLSNCDGLVIPGGESTTMTKVIKRNFLSEALISFSKDHNIFGTCAGSIIMSKNKVDSEIDDKKIFSIGCMSVDIKRNAWGSQINSFHKNIRLDKIFNKYYHQKQSNLYFSGIFIRAPKIISYQNDCKVLGLIDDIPVLVRNKLHLMSTFHPELTNDYRFHLYFTNLCLHY